MSAAAVARHPARPEVIETPRRRIEIVPSREQRRARPKVAHALIAVAGVFAVFAAQLGLSIALSAGAYRIGDLQDRQRELQRTQEHLDELLQVSSSTQHLAVNAAALGMVPGGSQYYVDLATGAVAAAPGMTDPFGCGVGCSLVPNSLAAGLPLATAPVGAKVVGTVAKPAAAVAAPATAGTGAGAAATADGTTAAGGETAASAVVGGGASASVDSPVASDTLPSPVTH